MKKVKASLVAVVLCLSVGVTFATKENSAEQVITCSQYPDGQGTIGTPSQFGCKTTPVQVCCYRLPDNFILFKH